MVEVSLLFWVHQASKQMTLRRQTAGRPLPLGGHFLWEERPPPRQLAGQTPLQAMGRALPQVDMTHPRQLAGQTPQRQLAGRMPLRPVTVQTPARQVGERARQVVGRTLARQVTEGGDAQMLQLDGCENK